MRIIEALDGIRRVLLSSSREGGREVESGTRRTGLLFVMVSRIRELARWLRQEATPAEQIMWEVLRNRRLGGWKFLRQHPLVHTVILGRQYQFIADFYCAAAKLVIEIDGGIHREQTVEDDVRDEMITEQGVATMRILNEEVQDLAAVRKRILDMVVERAG